MNREELYSCLDNIENFLWKLQFIKGKFMRSATNLLLERNKILKNTHKGETCFILGNGPSLKTESRIAEVAKYQVFTVNQFYRSNLFEIVQPNYHIMIDPLFFNLDSSIPSELETLNWMQKVSLKKEIKLIFPVDHTKFVKENITDRDDIIYVKNRYRLNEKYLYGFNMSEYLPGAYNVVLAAMYCAIYMGFTRIVLLGCDMTGLLDYFVQRDEKNNEVTFTHVYDYTENELKRMRNVHNLHDNEFELNGFNRTFHDFRITRDLCKKKGIIVVNATKTTALDNLDYTTLEYELNMLEEKNERND